jgi:hypothetical protein
MSADHSAPLRGRQDLPWPYGRAADGVSRACNGDRPAPATGTTRGPRARSAALPPQAPVHPAEAAQARLFVAILRAEIEEFEALADATEARWKRRQQDGLDGDLPPEALTRLRLRIKEVQLMLDALRARFPMIVTGTDI